jgi:hypothetical protein
MTDDDDVGSVAEEAAKLLHALQGWAKESGSEYGGATAAAADAAASMAQQVNEHVAAGGVECTYCPVCRMIAAVRSTSPEVRQHLSVAATSLMHAAAELMATDVAGASDRSKDAATTKIDLDDDWEDD